MNCLSELITSCGFALEHLGLYEPEISITEASNRLKKEKAIWVLMQEPRAEVWNEFQKNNNLNGKIPPIVEKALSRLGSKGIYTGVAVDLGCGISSTTIALLQRGWKVYAVDSSASVINTLADKVSSIRREWLIKGQLVLVNQTIEEFQFPEKVHLIIAIDSLPYCDPEEIGKIFLKAKNALLPRGTLACTLHPYSDDEIKNNIARVFFGAWLTKKNIIEAIMRCVNFNTWSVEEGRNVSGLSEQYHVIAQN